MLWQVQVQKQTITHCVISLGFSAPLSIPYACLFQITQHGHSSGGRNNVGQVKWLQSEKHEIGEPEVI